MRTTIKAATILTALIAGTAIAGAQDQQRPERPNQRPAEFRCPVCGSPCISKAVAQRQFRQRWLRNQDQQPARANQRDRIRDRIAGEQPGPRPNEGQQFQGNRQQRGLRFDINGDGQLSKAERAARRAYRQALSQEQGNQPNRRPAPPPQGDE